MYGAAFTFNSQAFPSMACCALIMPLVTSIASNDTTKIISQDEPHTECNNFEKEKMQKGEASLLIPTVFRK